ncbi:hypothetical protein BB559_005064 [Furculomyces boomerangus]|uniref:SWR1-complex protein 5 n=1 Tax=Furculomyces boomerangus TaxID=61424 RepID=A0A2T9YB47_9FUNG|nr:hypothetical protein BB559_005064 [Furculomyces boomerangus]
MSLEKFYYGDLSDEDSSDSSFDIHNVQEESSSESEDENAIDNNPIPGSSKEAENEAEIDSKKRKIDDIWNEMNQEPGKKNKQVDQPEFVGKGKERYVDPTLENKPIDDQNSKPKENGQIQDKESKIPDPISKTSGVPQRKPSKFSQIEAQVEKTLGKKLNTVEKSKLQWDNYVEKEDIKDELTRHNKDGYVEKMEFLQRVDEKQHEYTKSLKK